MTGQATNAVRIGGPAGRGGPRRQQLSASTRRRLVASGTTLFAERGYSGTCLDDVAAAAKVTKGALYHHYDGKRGLFEAVYESVETGAVRGMADAVAGVSDPWQRTRVAVAVFLQVCQQPSYRRIVIMEGPAVLGDDRFRMIDATHAIVYDNLLGAFASDQLPTASVDALARVVCGGMRAAGMSVAHAGDPEAAGQEYERVIATVLAGVRLVSRTSVTSSA